MNDTTIWLPDIVGGGYKDFWESKHRYRVVKGSRRSKKSTTTALWFIYNIMKYPKANALVVRKVAATLKDSCFAQLKWAAHQLGCYDCWEFKLSPLEAVYHRTKDAPAQHIYFRGLDDPFKITSITVEYGCLCWAWVEEAFEIESEEEFDTFNESLMGELPEGYFRQTTLTFNPWNGSTWLKRRFFDEARDDVFAMTTTYRCNEWLSDVDKAYFEDMRLTNPNRFKVAGDGDWGIDGAQFFEELRDDPAHYQDRRWTHIIEPFNINSGDCRGWTVMRSYDFGYNKPFSLGYWAMDYDGVLYRFMEYYGCTGTPNEGVKWSPDEQFRRIAEFEKEHPWLKGRKITDSVADPSIWDKSRGESIAETAMRYGVYFTPGDNHRVPGWMQVHYRMQFDANGYPRMYVFNNCKAFIRTIPLMTYSATKPEDLDTELEDHCADEVRYMCMSRPIQPILQKEEKVIVNDPLNMFTKRR